jgi:hypothetical protein
MLSAQNTQKVRVLAHVASAVVWAWGFVKALFTGNWGKFLERLALGIAGHVATEVLLG